jgi:hypothetical protein
MASSSPSFDDGRGPFSYALDATFDPLAIERRCRVVVNRKKVVAKLHGKRRQGYRLRKLRRMRNTRIVKNGY